MFKIRFLYRQLFLFYLPNLKRILNSSIKYDKAPLVEQSLLITGKGKVTLGRKSKFGYKLGGFHKGGSIELQARSKEANIIIGNNVATNNNVFICSERSIKIEDDVLIGQNVTIMDFEAHGVQPSMRRNNVVKGDIVIGTNVWIGNNVIILKDTVLGENLIVAAGAVVSGVFPSNVIIGGVPAKIIKKLNE